MAKECRAWGRSVQSSSRVGLALGTVGWLAWGASALGQLMPESDGRALARLERGWVANAGQWDKQAAFAAPGTFGTTWVTAEGELRHVLEKRKPCDVVQGAAVGSEAWGRPVLLPCNGESWVVSERMVGGAVTSIRGEEKLETRVSYFLGSDSNQHRSGLPTFRYVSLGEVWPGVEVQLKASQKTVEKLFSVAPGGKVGSVVVAVSGAESLRLAPEGAIVARTGLGEVELSKPVAWQERDGARVPVEVAYRLLGQDRYGFVVEQYDPNRLLIIDPILQSTYLGGSGVDRPRSLRIAPSGEVVVAGVTGSADFPSTSGGWQPGASGGGDVFLARLNSDLTSFLQSTYLGGNSLDQAHALAFASNGDIYVGGRTLSSDFPGTSGGAQGSNLGLFDGFVARLNGNLTNLLQATYLGGAGLDGINALSLSSSGEVIVAGFTTSDNLPNTAGGAQPSFGSGSQDAFVTRLNSTLTTFLQSTYLGGSGWEEAYALELSTSGDVYVAGATNSNNFPATSGAFQVDLAGAADAFVTRLNSGLTGIVASTFLGGFLYDDARALTIASNGNVVVAGSTASNNFPVSFHAAQFSRAGMTDAFIVRLNAGLAPSPFLGTYLGGTQNDEAEAVAMTADGDVVVVGFTNSVNFPQTAGGAQPSLGGDVDGFITRLNDVLSTFRQSTYLGGNDFDRAYALAISAGGELVVAGETGSSGFPGTENGAQSTLNGFRDAFVARLSADLIGWTDMVANAPTVPPALAPGGSSSGLTFGCTNAGSNGATNATCSVTASAGVVSGVSCTPAVPVGVLAAGATIACTFTYTAPGSAGGSDTAETDVTFTVVAGAGNDNSATNNTNSSGPVPLVDALDDGGGFLGGAVGATFPLGANDQVGAGSPPGGSSFSFSGGSCAGASVNATTGVATFDVPASGTCTLGYQLCFAGACDGAALLVTALVTDMVANAPTVPPALAPGGSSSGLTFGCTNAGSNGATNATCSVTASAGVVSGVSCTPAVPVGVLAAGATIACTFTYTAPGSAGGSDTAETDVTFTVVAGAGNDNSATNNTNSSGPVPLVDALDDGGGFLGGAVGATFPLGANDQVGAGSPPGGSSFSFSGGSCAGASVNATTGVATFDVPASGTCTVGYQLCFSGVCDEATLLVTVQLVLAQPIPTVGGWGVLALLVVLGVAAVLLLRRKGSAASVRA